MRPSLENGKARADSAFWKCFRRVEFMGSVLSFGEVASVFVFMGPWPWIDPVTLLMVRVCSSTSHGGESDQGDVHFGILKRFHLTVSLGHEPSLVNSHEWPKLSHILFSKSEIVPVNAVLLQIKYEVGFILFFSFLVSCKVAGGLPARRRLCPGPARASGCPAPPANPACPRLGSRGPLGVVPKKTIDKEFPASRSVPSNTC